MGEGDAGTDRDAQGACAHRRRWPSLQRLIAVAAVAVSLSGCGFFLPDRIHYQWQPGTDPALPDGAAEAGGDAGGDAMIGLALSGGGSRAALFAAAVLEQLAEAGLALQITHISSVSGGGFAAAYFATHPLAAACPGGDRACQRRYFAAFFDT
ncbi:MAG: patatin-like phospholipase family protein, partial [Rhodospirillaceae bacterium]|nr:patatin-like phospholipase family protein [Rhodospirillaceae bacterium]